MKFTPTQRFGAQQSSLSSDNSTDLFFAGTAEIVRISLQNPKNPNPKKAIS